MILVTPELLHQVLYYNISIINTSSTLALGYSLLSNPVVILDQQGSSYIGSWNPIHLAIFHLVSN